MGSAGRNYRGQHMGMKKLSFNKWLTTTEHNSIYLRNLAADWGSPSGRPTVNFVKRRAVELGHTAELGETAFNAHRDYLNGDNAS